MKTFILILNRLIFSGILLMYTSCNGQVKTELPKYLAGESGTKPPGYPKLVRTQGSKAGDNVRCGMQDKAGNLWFGTTGDGVYCYDGKLFTNYTIKNGLGSNCVWSILEDSSGYIWFGTDAGVARYDGRTISSIPIYSNLNIFQANTRNKNAVWSMLQDKSGVIWFGTDQGLYYYNGFTFSRLLDKQGIVNKNGLTLKSIQCMHEDRDGNLWLGSGPMAFEGICRFDGKSVTNFRPKNVEWIRNIMEDKNGSLIFVTRTIGTIRYSDSGFSESFKPLKLRNDLMHCGFVDSKGNDWYTSDYLDDKDFTVGGVWKSDGKSVTEYTKRDGLTNTSVMFMMEDKRGDIWFGTRITGLYKFDGKTFTDFSE